MGSTVRSGAGLGLKRLGESGSYPSSTRSVANAGDEPVERNAEHARKRLRCARLNVQSKAAFDQRGVPRRQTSEAINRAS